MTKSTFVQTISNETKIEIAMAAIKEPGIKNLALAAMFGVSESSVRRAKKDFAAEAQAKLDELNAKQAQTQSKETKTKKKKFQDFPTRDRGFQGFNGRVAIHDQVFAELGLDAKSKELFDECNKRAVEYGLRPISRGSFYAMLSVARRGKKETNEIEE